MKTFLRFLAGASSLLLAAAAHATNLTYTEPAIPPAPSLGGLLLRMAIALLVVIGLIYATAWMLRRAQPHLAARRSRTRKVDGVAVESHVSLGARRSIYAVRWGRFRLLLGAGGSEITLLASEWADGEGGAPPGELPDEASFGRHLDDFLSRLGREEDEPLA